MNPPLRAKLSMLYNLFRLYFVARWRLFKARRIVARNPTDDNKQKLVVMEMMIFEAERSVKMVLKRYGGLGLWR